MATINLDRRTNAVTVIAAAAAATAVPGASSDVYLVADSTATMYVSYTGAPSGTIQVWLRDGTDWYKGASHAFNSTNGPTAISIAVPSRGFTLQVATFTGTAATVTAKVTSK